MRLLFLTDSFRPSRSACANRACVLVDAMRNAGVNVQVLASSDSLLGAPEGYKKPDYVTFFETFPLQEKTLVNSLKNNFGGQRASIKAAEGMGAFDVVVCTTPPLLLTTSAIKIAKRKGAKLVLDVRDVWPDVAYETYGDESIAVTNPSFELYLLLHKDGTYERIVKPQHEEILEDMTDENR